jgi:hypothetical protein
MNRIPNAGSMLGHAELEILTEGLGSRVNYMVWSSPIFLSTSAPMPNRRLMIVRSVIFVVLVS